MTKSGFAVGLVVEDRELCNGTESTRTPTRCKQPTPGLLTGCCLSGVRIQCVYNERLCQELLTATTFGVSGATGAMGLALGTASAFDTYRTALE